MIIETIAYGFNLVESTPTEAISTLKTTIIALTGTVLWTIGMAYDKPKTEDDPDYNRFGP